jgi:D-alanyl-D-alanine carboxypeptidase/D-alanyl-D-alanine-endopeptidase (penicillin-binding protein 4)
MTTLRRKALALLAATVLGAGILVANAPAAVASGDCSVSALASDSRLASFSGYVSDVATGDKLFSRNGTKAKRTGSVLKLLTAAAAIEVLGPKYRLTTRVFAGKKAGTVVLVGGGDPTLSRVSSGFYPGAPRLSDLASQVKKAMKGTKITKIVVDSSYWPIDDNWDPTWARSEQRIGYHSETTALQVDGDRANPRANTSPRSTDPIKKAGKYFAAALGVPNVKVVKGVAPEGTKRLGYVKSQPISSLVKTMLLVSDNALAESLARVVSKESGANGSSASLATVIPAALSRYGFDTTGMKIRDGSGLSHKNAVSPKFMTTFLAQLVDGEHKLKYVYNGLSVAGRSGSLAARFTGSSAVARGHVWGKTGWLETSYSLAGIVRAKDGSELAFAFYAIRPGISASAKMALDALTAGVYRCGLKLSNS